MESKRLNLQLVLIYTIIIAAFLGSALFFSYLNTDAMMTAVEKETDLAASILATGIPAGDTPEQEAAQRMDLAIELGERLTQSLSDVGVEIDVWVVGDSGLILYAQGDIFPDGEWKATDRASLSPHASVMRWIGQRNLFWLDQSLYLARRIAHSDMYLVALNHCSAIRAVQRRQFTLFVSIEMILILTMIVLLTNTISSYRRLLIQLATTDELTGLANRKSFLRTFGEFTEKRKEGFCMFLVDIDYFKKVNDGYGHAAGDAALQLLARNIRRMVGEHNGFAGRWGGDEFIGVLPLQGAQAHAALSEMCRRVNAEPMEGDLHISISAGVAEVEPGAGLSRLSEMADRALYMSKARGKNQASLYDPAEAAELPEADLHEAMARQSAFAAGEKKQAAAAAAQPEAAREDAPALSVWARLRRYLRERLLPATLLGVRWMAPFVAGGGILIGLAFLFDASSVNLAALPVAERANFGTITRVAATLKSIGGSTFNFMLPAFAGFMAYGLAGENAFMAGFIGGYMTINSNSGFIGAMVAGLAAGVIVTQMERFNEHMPAVIRKAAPIVIYPVFNLLLMQAVTLLIISPISKNIGSLFDALLDTTVGGNNVWSGALLGGMMAIDFGGIINKVAYNYGVNGLAAGHTQVMASVMAGGMIPPLGIALSMVMFHRKYNLEDRERGIGTLFMGLSFITEGALPFVFSDPIRVVSACMVGSAAAGLLSMAFGCALPAPHGGIFVIPVMEHPVFFLLALLCGSLLTALILGLLKKDAD